MRTRRTRNWRRGCAKADLLTDMVGEFPELQGIMGRYYALHDGEDKVVADAIEAHYHPRFAGDTLPQGAIACAVALADKLETLVGIYGIGQIPTGDKDPFGLRRHALGILRILIETPLDLPLPALIKTAAGEFPRGHAERDGGKRCGRLHAGSPARLSARARISRRRISRRCSIC